MISHIHKCTKSEHFHYIFRSVHCVLYVDLSLLNSYLLSFYQKFNKKYNNIKIDF
jgi:hypothetical protein